MIALIVVLLNVVLLVGGQILWKIALTRIPLRSFSSILPLMQQPAMLFGCLLFILATVIWFFALSRYDLSRIYPLQSLAYVVGAVCGILLFKETMTGIQWMGILFIIGGAMLVANA